MVRDQKKITIRFIYYLSVCLFVDIYFFYYFFLFQELTAILSREKKEGVCVRVWCVRRGLLQDRLPVKFQGMKFTVPKCKHEIS